MSPIHIREFKKALDADGLWEDLKESLMQSVRVQLDAVQTPEAAFQLALEIKAIEMMFSKVEELITAYGAKDA